MGPALCWARRDERRRRLPGDDRVPQPIGVITHAITIEAPPEAVWPWLVQLGSGRAGWYAYDHIDNGGRPSARRIIPELQQTAVGGVLPALPGAKDMFVVGDVRPDRALILIVPLRPAIERSPAAAGVSVPAARASWALVLEPLAPGRTRLIARSRISRDWLTGPEVGSVTPGKPLVIERIYGLLATMPVPLMLAVAGGGHYLMESRMLRGIKRRAERIVTIGTGDGGPLALEEVSPARHHDSGGSGPEARPRRSSAGPPQDGPHGAAVRKGGCRMTMTRLLRPRAMGDDITPTMNRFAWAP